MSAAAARRRWSLPGVLTIGMTWLAMDRLILRPIETRTIKRWGLMRDGLERA
jgi:hypothetical protein